MSVPPARSSSRSAELPDGWLAYRSDALPARLSVGSWLLASAAFLLAYGTLFVAVHPYVDTRKCVAQLVDPLLNLIPYNRHWYFVSHEIYYVVTVSTVISLLVTALRGDHRPAVRWVMALGFEAMFRSVTLVLLPLCKVTVAPGTAARAVMPRLYLFGTSIPWLTWATNDLVFSGHVCEFLLLSWATRHWPTWARVGLGVFQVVQAYALLATRGHYTIDILVAIPFALLADTTALMILSKLARSGAQVVPA